MIAVALFCVACAAYWLWRRKHANTTEPPYLPGAWPIVGHAPLLVGDSCNLWKRFNEIAKQSCDMGGVVAASLGTRIAYIVTDPADSFTVLSTCLEKDSLYDFSKPWIGDGLVTARSTSLGVDFTHSNLNNTYMKAMEQMFHIFTERLMKFWWHSPYIFAWSDLKKKQDACVKKLINISDTVLHKRKTKFNGSRYDATSIPGTKCKPFIDILLELSAEQGVFTDKQIREHVDTLLGAGHDTSANVLMFSMILLGSHPEAQEKVFAEIKEILGEDRDVEKTDLSKLVYLEAFLKEGMRMLPPVPILARKLDTDVKLTNCTLSAGRTCALFIFAMQKHPSWGPDAHEFKPERWLEPGKLPDNPHAFAAFSLGKRQCIGRAYALMSMKTTLAHVVRRYRIQADYTKVRLKFDVMLKPDAGHYISIERRT